MGFIALDYVILIGYLIGITVFGTMFRRTHRTTADYFVGTRRTHWLVISLSIVATETSSLTLIGVPAQAYATYAHPEQGGAMTFLQVVIGYIIARVVISVLLIPAYFSGNLLTAYELLNRRFGPRAKHVAASLFMVMRALADGVRVFAASLVVGVMLQTNLGPVPHLWLWAILAVGALTLIYTFEGGIAAVIWTDLIQLVIYVAGSLLAAWILVGLVPGGWPAIAGAGVAAGKFQIWSFSWDPTLPFTFWAGVAGGTFLTMASHGTDQLLVQRLLACRNLRDAQKALVASGLIVFAQFVLFLVVGVMLYAYYQHVPAPAMSTPDEVFPLFIVQHLSGGLAGLVIAALGLRSFIPFLKPLEKSAIILLATLIFFASNILTIKDLEEIPWNIVLLFGGAMSIGFCLWQTGAANWLAVNWLLLFQNATWFVFVMGVAFFVLIMTNFIMNVAAIAISLPVALVIAPYLGVAPEVILFASLATAGMPFLLLIGAAPNAIAYESRQFSSGEFFRAGIPASLILMIILGLFVWLIWPMMGMPVLVK
jgi:uncharacterized sodium:solute symporter family permease YidK